MREFDSVKAAIEQRAGPVTVFFRDDDVGWGNERLSALCHRFSLLDAPLDLAVIPGSLDSETADNVMELVRICGSILRLHQHGYSHSNHESSGRKSEFGSSRSIEEKFRDVEQGQSRLHEVLGDRLDPIFTPPWNRCSADTCEVLEKLGFTALSRITGSDVIDYGGLTDISVSIDWQKRKSGTALTDQEFDRYAAARFQENDIVGVMLHHEQMTDDALDRLCVFIAGLKDSKNVNFSSMMQLSEFFEATNRGKCSGHG